MSRPYIDQDTADQAREVLRTGVAVEVVAARLGIDTGELQQLLGLPQWRADAAADDGPCDLWAADDLNEVP